MKLTGWKKLFCIALAPLLAGSVYALYQAGHDNFYQITKGEAYRSAQMDGDDLKECIDTYHIRSILNLRGKAADEEWYRQEVKVSAEKNVRHFDLFISAYRELSEEETRILTGIIESAPRPVLIHCQAGADRSGLAAAMWKVIVDRETKSEAGKQLSIWYGHLAVGPASAMDRFFAKWRPGPKNTPGATAVAGK